MTVVDTTPPVLTVPDNLVVPATSLDVTVVNYTAASATDTVNPNPVVGCYPPSGAELGLGITTVTCSANDAFPGDSISWWPAEGNADDAADSNDGTLAGGAAFAPGIVGQAFSFTSPGDMVEIPPSPSLNLESLQSSTFEGWFRSNGGDAVIVAQHVCGVPTGWFFTTSQGGFIGNHFIGGSGVGGLDLNDGVLHHFAVVKDGTSYLEYVDGAVISSDSGPLVGTPAAVGTPMQIGSLNTGSCAPGAAQLDGLVDELKLYDRALSADEILAKFNTPGNGAIDSFTVKVAPLEVDAKPGSQNNPLNLSGRGVLPVGILGDDDYDVTDIKFDTLRIRADLVGALPVGPAHGAAHILDNLDDDGLADDLMLHFRYDEMGIGLGNIVDGVVVLLLSGELDDGTPIVGSSFVSLRPISGPLAVVLSSSGGPPPVDQLPPGLLKRAEAQGEDEGDDDEPSPGNSGAHRNDNGKGKAKGHDKGADPDPEAAGADPDPDP